MEKIRLAYRDNDRTPVIFCIKEMAREHYDLDVEVLHIQPRYEHAIKTGEFRLRFRPAHGGDDVPTLGRKEFGGRPAKAGGGSCDQNGWFHKVVSSIQLASATSACKCQSSGPTLLY